MKLIWKKIRFSFNDGEKVKPTSIIFSRKKNYQKICVPSLCKIFRSVNPNTLIIIFFGLNLSYANN